MREKIVYFLGAGFSAPLGLPVMANFLINSKDLYFSNPTKYGHFQGVFDVINNLGRAKNYYAVDLFNIEEILSLLEMEDYVGTSKHKEAYLNYLRDVISDHTPVFMDAEKPRKNSNDSFSGNYLLEHYSAFVATLFGLRLTPDGSGARLIERQQDAPAYGVISLNYDLVLERALELVVGRAVGEQWPKFARNLEEAADEAQVPLAKLHGSVEPLTIVPPTWNKVANEAVKDAWRLAYRLLADATQIRFLGYSLPQSDTYVRYLLESAVLESSHLKRIDVICLDNAKSAVENRFRDLITFYRLRFRSGDIARYLESAEGRREQGTVAVSFDKLEQSHEYKMVYPMDW